MSITPTAPTTWRDMLGQSNSLFEEAKNILLDSEADSTQKDRIEGLMEEGKNLKAKAMRLKDLEGSMAATAEMISKHPTQAANPEDAADVDELALAQQKAAEAKEQKSNEFGFARWNEYLVAVWETSVGVKADPRLVRVRENDNVIKGDRKDLSAASGAAGGFLIPDEFHEELMAAMVEQNDIRRLATRIPMRRQVIKVPVLDQTGTTAGQPHFFGGMQFYWTAAATEKTSTDPSFRQIQLEAHKLIGLTRAADELVDDSAISLAAFLQGPLGFAGGVAWMEEYAFYNGTGAGQPLGIINAGATITESRVTANTVDFDDFADMLANFLPSSKGMWTINQALMSQVIQLNGPSGNPAYVWTANARDGIPNQILGYPVKWSEKVPGRGSAGDVSLADWSYYLLGDRGAQTIESTKFDRWAYDETSWRVVHRVDGQPWLSAPLTLQDGTTTISPFVILGATATGT